MRPPAAIASCLALALASCGGGGGGGAASVARPAPDTVRAANFAFTPDALTVHVGTTVTWVIDQPDAPHNVVSLSGPTSFNSGAPVGRGTFRFAFTQVGTYVYDCEVHPSMKGTIVVTP
ncbi:MAG: cupredoxin domain-containing protein [Acidimicrobiales bacterium]